MSSAVLKRAAQSLRRLPNSTAAPFGVERPYGLSRLCASLRLQQPVCPHLSLRRSPVATGLGLMMMGWDREGLITCAMTLIKVRKSCGPSPSLSRSRPPMSSGKTRSYDWRWRRMQWMTKMSYAPHLVLCTPQRVAETALHSIQPCRFRSSPPDPVFVCVGSPRGFETRRLASPGFARQAKRFTGVWPLLRAHSYLELQVRVECRWGPRWTNHPKVRLLVRQRYHPSLTPQTPIQQNR